MLRNIESLSNVFAHAVLTGRGRVRRDYRISERNLGRIDRSIVGNFNKFTNRVSNGAGQ